MLRKDFILHKTKRLLSEYLNPIIANTDKPRQKFLRQAVAAILLSGCLVVKEPTRWIHDDCSDLFFGLVEGFEKEMGYFSLAELESVRGPMGLPIERDLYWKPKKLKEIAPEIFKK